jgi:hypothetical protein
MKESERRNSEDKIVLGSQKFGGWLEEKKTIN